MQLWVLDAIYATQKDKLTQVFKEVKTCVDGVIEEKEAQS